MDRQLTFEKNCTRSLTWSTCYQIHFHRNLYKWQTYNLYQWLNKCKNVPETLQWGKNGLNLKLKHRKAQKSIFIQEIWWPVQESRKSVPHPWDSQIIQESWHKWHYFIVLPVTCHDLSSSSSIPLTLFRQSQRQWSMEKFDLRYSWSWHSGELLLQANASRPNTRSFLTFF